MTSRRQTCKIYDKSTTVVGPIRTNAQKLLVVAVSAILLLWPCRAVLGWGHEGHEVIALIAEHYMTKTALSRAKELLDGKTIDGVASWADYYRHFHPETGPWHYINIPLADSKIDLAKECPKGDCVIAKTEQFLAVLKDPNAERAKKAQALKFVIHFIGDLHQPLHDENDGDAGGNRRHVIFDGHRDNLHWIWDTGLLEDIDRNPETFATKLEIRITDEDRKRWERGSIEGWALETHRLAQSVAYGDLEKTRRPVITKSYEKAADSVIELQLEKAGVRLAYLMDSAL